MGADSGDYSGSIFDEAKRYIIALCEQDVPFVDLDFNDYARSTQKYIQRLIQHGLGNFRINSAFQIYEATPNVNDVMVRGGDGTIEGAGRLFNSGMPCILKSAVHYDNLGATFEQKSIHGRSTGLSTTTLTDSAAKYAVNELAGRELRPNITSATSFTIISNTPTSIVTAGNLTTVAASGDRYLVELSTPGAGRVDHVYLDTYLDEIGSSEDPNLLHSVGSLSTESFRRKEVVQTVKIREDIFNGDGRGPAPNVPFTDADGNVHHYTLLAVLTRDANNTVTQAEIDDWFGRVIQPALEFPVQIVGADDANVIFETVGSGVDERDVVTLPTAVDSRIRSPGVPVPADCEVGTNERAYLIVNFAMSTTDADPVSLQLHYCQIAQGELANKAFTAGTAVNVLTDTVGKMLSANRNSATPVGALSIPGPIGHLDTLFFKLSRLGSSDTHGGNMLIASMVLRLPINPLRLLVS